MYIRPTNSLPVPYKVVNVRRVCPLCHFPLIYVVAVCTYVVITVVRGCLYHVAARVASLNRKLRSHGKWGCREVSGNKEGIRIEAVHRGTSLLRTSEIRTPFNQDTSCGPNGARNKRSHHSCV